MSIGYPYEKRDEVGLEERKISYEEIKKAAVEALYCALGGEVEKERIERELGDNIPLSNYGFDSLDSLQLIIELEEELDLDIPQTLEDRWFFKRKSSNVSLKEIIEDTLNFLIENPLSR